ncbi:MAG: divergent polysaccharide deacetylase family protein [Candidatus Omnitrophota bacterium]|nr:divergent polysaccharide deacetylase family protein [Candidatus Omnitrophota bacterium]
MKRRPTVNPFPALFILGFAIISLIIILYKAPVKHRPRPEGVVAFVIDDWGYSLNNLDSLFQIDRPVTLAVLPHLLYSEKISEKVRGYNRGYDIILHLPLESKSGKASERDTIRRNMKKDRALSILKSDIDAVPGAIGVSNHQGSRATENRETMKIILEELKKRNLFFLDSRTTPVSVCGSISAKIGLRYAERDVFLDLAQKKDEKQYRAYVRKQIRELINVAKAKGSAIGIGHDKKITLEVIKESIPDIEKENIKIVPLRKLVGRYEK